MKTPSRGHLKAANRSLALFGIIAGAAAIIWEGSLKLGEHIVLTWVAEHLGGLSLVLRVTTWTSDHPVEMFLFIGVVYCLLVIGRAFYFSPESAAPPAEIRGPTERLAPAPPPKRKPHFQFLGLDLSDLYFSPDPREGIRPPASETQEQDSVRGVTLRFVNLAKDDGTSKRAMNVVARMRLYSDNWMHFADVDYGVWLGSAAECTDMDVGDVRQVVLLIYGPQNVYYALRDMRHTGRFEIGESYVREIDVSWAVHVEIILADQQSHKSATWVFSVTPQATSCSHHEAYPPPTAARMPR